MRKVFFLKMFQKIKSILWSVNIVGMFTRYELKHRLPLLQTSNSNENLLNSHNSHRYTCTGVYTQFVGLWLNKFLQHSNYVKYFLSWGIFKITVFPRRYYQPITSMASTMVFLLSDLLLLSFKQFSTERIRIFYFSSLNMHFAIRIS